MAVRHSKEEIAAFLDGETRLIAAAYQGPERAGDVFVMPDGAADSVREFTRRDLRCMFPGRDLRCMFPGCRSPRLRAVSRSKARDGFAHDVGGGHAPESLNHLQGKAVVADWLRQNLHSSAVKVEHAADTQRQRIPDILVTLASGRQIAFEVQYASLTVADWRDRHSWYAERGISDVWLWGHTRLKRSRSEYAPGDFTLDAVQRAAVEAGQPVLFLNPNTAEIAVATAPRGLGGPPRMPELGRRDTDVVVEPIKHYVVAEGGRFTGRLLAELLAGTAKVNEEERAAAIAREEQELQDQEEADARTRALHVSAREQRAADRAARAAAGVAGASSASPTRTMRHRRPRHAPERQGPQHERPAPTCSTCGEPMFEWMRSLGRHFGSRSRV